MTHSASSLKVLTEIDGQIVNVSGLDDALNKIIHRTESPKSFFVATLNLDHLVKLRQSESYRKAYSRAEIVTSDGFSVSLLARLSGATISRAPGSEIVEPLCEMAASRGLPIFLVGSTLASLGECAGKLVRAYPGLEIAGAYAPPRGFEAYSPIADEVMETVRNSGARLCFVALGAPRQEMFSARAIDETENIGFVAVGAALDFIAGTQIRSPSILRRLYLEWAWRLASNPRRLGGRYVLCAMLFIKLLPQRILHRKETTSF